MNNDKLDVPWAKVKPVVITLDNMHLEIDDGAVTQEALCKGMPKVGPCKS